MKSLSGILGDGGTCKGPIGEPLCRCVEADDERRGESTEMTLLRTTMSVVHGEEAGLFVTDLLVKAQDSGVGIFHAWDER